MLLPVIADTARVALNYRNTTNGLTATNVMHFLAPGKDEDDIIASLDANVTDEMWGTLSNAAYVDEVVITLLDGTPDGRVFPVSTLSGEWHGPSGSQQFSPQVAALMKLATGATGRSGRGRIFLPFTNEGASQDGLIDATIRDATTAAWVAFANAQVADNIPLAVASYKLETASQVLNIACEVFSATIRRRNRR